MKKLIATRIEIKMMIGMIVPLLNSPLLMSWPGSPNIIAAVCLRNPINTSAKAVSAAIVTIGCDKIPADKMENSVRKIPKGGIPVIAKKPMMNKIPVIGSAPSAPLTLAIFVELYFKKILPDDRNKIDLAKE